MHMKILYTYIYIYIYIYLSVGAGCDIRSNFRRSLAGLNSDFSFLTGYHTKVEEPVCPTIYP